MRGLLLLPALLVGACSFEPGMIGSLVDSSIDGADIDRDNDMVVDTVDNCPDDPNTDQRDWDDDDHGDVCDGCPHLASAADPDGDGDSVGDACDPRPSMAGDRRVLWVAFYTAADITGWTNTGDSGAWSVEPSPDGGELVQTNTGFALLDSPLQYGDVYFAARAELVTTSNELGFCSANRPIGMQYYCCGAYYFGAARAISAWPGQAPIGDTGTFPAGAAGETVDFVGTIDSSDFRCAVSKGGTTVDLMTPRGPLMLGTAVFYTTVPTRYHYAFVAAIGS